MLGLDNAATPLGLKAVQELQELNPVKTGQQCANPVSGDQHRMGDAVSRLHRLSRTRSAQPTQQRICADPAAATYVSTMAGMVLTALIQRLKLLTRVVSPLWACRHW